MGLFSKKKKYLFTEPENTACFTCAHVVEGQQPVLFATHDFEDGSWQFLCGQNAHETADARVLGLKQLVDLDQTLNQLFEMPKGVGAQREAVGKPWKPFRNMPAE